MPICCVDVLMFAFNLCALTHTDIRTYIVVHIYTYYLLILYAANNALLC